MPLFTLLLALLFFHWLSHALALLDLQQFVVSILWLIWNCANTRLFSVVRIWLPWVPPHDLSTGLSLIARFLLVLVSLLPRLPLCVFSAFHDFPPPPPPLVLSLLETALARQILSPLLFPSLTPLFLFPPLPPIPLVLLPPLPLLPDVFPVLFSVFSVSCQLLSPYSLMSVIGLRSYLVIKDIKKRRIKRFNFKLKLQVQDDNFRQQP